MVSPPRCANSHRVPVRVTPPRPRPHILAHSDVTASWMTRLCSSALVSLFAALEGLGTPMPCRGSWGRFCDDPQAFALPCVCVRTGFSASSICSLAYLVGQFRPTEVEEGREAQSTKRLVTPSNHHNIAHWLPALSRRPHASLVTCLRERNRSSCFCRAGAV